MKSRIAPDGESAVIADYESGLSCQEIGSKLGIHRTAIARWLKRRGVVLRAPWVDRHKKAVYKRGPDDRRFKMRSASGSGYMKVYAPTHPDANRQGKVLEHRWVWEQAHGPLRQDQVVHHIDGNRSNNALENLVALTNAEHSRLHNTGAYRDPKAYIAAGRKGAAAKWARWREQQSTNQTP